MAGLKQYFVILIAVLVILVVIVVLPVSIFHPTYEKNEPKYQQIGGHVPVEIQLNNKFDSSEVEISTTTLSSNTIIAKPYAVVYYGQPNDVSIKTTILPNVSILLHSTTNKPEGANYYNDTPIYGLRGSNITYLILASTNSSSQGCLYVYFFNTLTSHILFLNGSHNFTYYSKSNCIFVKRNTCPVVTNYTINLKDDTFLFGGISANVSSSVNVAISGYRNEYNVSLLKSVEMNSSVSVTDLCTHLACFDRANTQILIDSNNFINATINPRYTEDHNTLIIVLSFGLGFALIVALVIMGCLFYRFKTVSINSLYIHYSLFNDVNYFYRIS